jgi:hypothetical protein
MFINTSDAPEMVIDREERTVTGVNSKSVVV